MVVELFNAGSNVVKYPDPGARVVVTYLYESASIETPRGPVGPGGPASPLAPLLN